MPSRPQIIWLFSHSRCLPCEDSAIFTVFYYLNFTLVRILVLASGATSSYNLPTMHVNMQNFMQRFQLFETMFHVNLILNTFIFSQD